MDQSEQEDMVLVKSMSDSIAGKFRGSLSDLEARLEHLSLQTPDIFYKKALHPRNIFQTFDDALGDNFDLPNKKTLFKFFNNHVALQLYKIYDDINNILIKADVLPQIKLHLNKSNTGSFPKRTSPAGEQGHTDANSLNDPEQDMNQGGYAMTAQPGHSYSGNIQDINTEPDNGQPGGSQGYGNMAAGSSSGNQTASKPGYAGTEPQAQAGSTGYQHNTAGMPASQVGEVVGEYLGGAPLRPQAPAGESADLADGTTFFPASTGQYYGHQEILNALSNVQQNPIFSNASTAQYDGEAIKQAVLSEIAKTSGGGVTKNINRIAEKTIDFIEDEDMPRTPTGKILHRILREKYGKWGDQ